MMSAYQVVPSSIMHVRPMARQLRAAACITLQGFGLGGEVPIAAVYISEIARAKGRGKFVLMYELVFPIGLVAAGLLGRWIIPNLGWQYMFLIGAIPAILALFMQRLLPESPRWLASQGRFEEADLALRKIENVALAEGKQLPALPANIPPVQATPTRFADLFKGIYLKRTLVLWCVWICTYIITYGLTTWAPSLFRTVYKLPLQQSLTYGFVLTGVGLIGAIFCALLIDPMGRKRLFALGLFMWLKLINKDITQVREGTFTWLSFIVSSVLFGLLHGNWLAGTLAGMAFAYALYRRGHLFDAVIAHSVTNLLLSFYVIYTENWSLW